MTRVARTALKRPTTPPHLFAVRSYRFTYIETIHLVAYELSLSALLHSLQSNFRLSRAGQTPPHPVGCVYSTPGDPLVITQSSAFPPLAHCRSQLHNHTTQQRSSPTPLLRWRWKLHRSSVHVYIRCRRKLTPNGLLLPKLRQRQACPVHSNNLLLPLISICSGPVRSRRLH